MTESLANDMLDLSLAVRDRDEEKLGEFISASLTATPWPAAAQPLTAEVKWVAKHAWAPAASPASNNGGEAQPMSGEEFLRGWLGFLDHFGELEDVRFKVKGATFDPSADVVPEAKVPTAKVGSTGQAKLSFFLIGRDTEGRREWLRGSAEVQVRRGESRWQFHRFDLTSVESLVATRDLFSEVALPAGVEVRLPPYGAPGAHFSLFAWNGAAAGDFNNDGWMDLFVTGPRRSYLYLNQGNGRFRDASSEAGLEGLHAGVAPLALDFDNDGDQDIFISAVGPQMLLENRLVPDGKLVFRDVSLPAGVAREAIGISATVGDVNADGYPDIYVACYNNLGPVEFNSFYRATNGTPNLLFINQGDGTFREEAEPWGVADRRWSYAAQFADVNADGQLDLYVANDAGENGLFINKGDRFVEEAVERGVLDPGYGMGVSFADYNNDGLLDLHVTNMSSTAGNRILGRVFPNTGPGQNVFIKIAAGNSLYENTGNGYFRDVTAEVGPFPGSWAWGGGFFDFDNDGWEDLYTPNGFISGKLMKDT
ncbi:MAG: VCBS repeat-containing protein [Acidobacteria bacterium]|nr:VCBS repeat-containing protein [Acidobacteriota bacterium]